MIKILKNPFYIYILSFLIVFSLYSLGWSNMYPKLGFTLILFFLITFGISALFGLAIDKLKVIGYSEISPTKGKREIIYLSIIIVGVIVEILYEGGSPLLSAIKGEQGMDYRDFGIKTFHVILVSFNSYLIVYMFHLFLSNRKKKYLIFYLLTFVPPLLIFSRGMIIIGLASSFVVFVSSLKSKITIKQMIIILGLLMVSMYYFGVLGNIRLMNSDKNYLLKISKASGAFYESKVPKEFYWTYLYGASPLANFQKNIDQTENADYNFLELIVSEIFPDMISKRIASIFEFEEQNIYKIANWLTVGTLFSKSYSYAMWFGPIILYIYSVFFIILIIGLVPKKSRYHTTAMAILSTIIFMNTFDNMFVFSGLILQLIYPIFFAYFENKKLIVK